MKHNFPTVLSGILMAGIICYACNHQNKTNSTFSRTNDLINETGSSETNYKKGAMLISKNDCVTCHSTDQKLVGPSYKEIAKKYGHDLQKATYLTNSVVQGSTGIWGSAVMPPHKTLRFDDIREMMLYILSTQEEK